MTSSFNFKFIKLNTKMSPKTYKVIDWTYNRTLNETCIYWLLFHSMNQVLPCNFQPRIYIHHWMRLRTTFFLLLIIKKHLIILDKVSQNKKIILDKIVLLIIFKLINELKEQPKKKLLLRSKLTVTTCLWLHIQRGTSRILNNSDKQLCLFISMTYFLVFFKIK